MGKRCQVCDGPIVNGRCKYCGMPYRNDMELYHLNEDRSEHYRHASAKVKKAMAENEIPLSDRNKTVPKAAKTSSARTQTIRTAVIKNTVEIYVKLIIDKFFYPVSNRIPILCHLTYYYHQNQHNDPENFACLAALFLLTFCCLFSGAVCTGSLCAVRLT